MATTRTETLPFDLTKALILFSCHVHQMRSSIITLHGDTDLSGLLWQISTAAKQGRELQGKKPFVIYIPNT